MGRVIADNTISLDGVSAGPNDGPGCGLGEGGERLHYWVFGRKWTYADDEARELDDASATGIDGELIAEMFGAAGAAIVGRRMFDAAGGWGYQNPFPFPCFVLTRRIDDELLAKAPSFTFVGDGIESALAQAQAVAGEKDVTVGGGANVIQQYLRAGLVDQLRLHVAPVTLGAGTRL